MEHFYLIFPQILVNINEAQLSSILSCLIQKDHSIFFNPN